MNNQFKQTTTTPVVVTPLAAPALSPKNDGYNSDSSLELDLDSNKQYTIRYKSQKSTLDYQNYFDNVLELIEHLVETNYTFDILRFQTVNSIIKDINRLFSHKNTKRKIYYGDLTPVDYHDYEDIIRCILDDNLFIISENDILMVHEHFNGSRKRNR